MPLPAGLREEHLCHIWERGLVDPARLVTGDGVLLHVVYPGRRCGDPGPDFRDAVIALPDATLWHGDVEVHADRVGWTTHGHQLDPAYDRVVLHVTWTEVVPVLTSAGVPVPGLALASCAALGLDELRRLPLRQRSPVGPSCPAAMPEEHLARLPAFLVEQGRARLETRAAARTADLLAMNTDQTLWRALLAALGYRRNAEPFARLAHVVPWSIASAIAASPGGRERLSALLLGAAGLLASTDRALPADDEARRAMLDAHWQALRPYCIEQPLPRSAWQFAGVRPDNAPSRRVAAAAALALAYPNGLAAAMTKAALADGPLLRVLSEEDYWRRHADFGRLLGPHGAALIGQTRQTEIAVNAILPTLLALARLHPNAALEQAVLRRYDALAASGGNQLTRHMLRTIGAPARAAASAAAEQGLLHLYHSWCRERRCWECPLPTAFATAAAPTDLVEATEEQQ